MKKYFIFSDVHSFYDELMESLVNKGFDIDNSEHIVISCGDIFDRGSKSKEVLDFIVGLLKKDRAICITGNHEDLMEEVFVREYFKGHDIHNGTDKTFKQLTTLDLENASPYDIVHEVKENEDLRYYLMKCKNYYELGDNIFVHGWIPFLVTREPGKFYWGDEPGDLKYDENWREAKYDKFFEARWVNGMSMWQQKIREPGKTIWCGHWNSSWGHAYLHGDGVEYTDEFETYCIDPDTGKQWPYSRHDTFIDEGIRALDATTAITNKVNVEVLEEDKIWNK